MQRRIPVDSDIPSSLCCPLTYEPFVNPVLGNDGRVYEYDAIVRHLASDSKSPFTREPFNLIPAVALSEQIKTIVNDWKEKNREWSEHAEYLKSESRSLETEVKRMRAELKTLSAFKELDDHNMLLSRALTQSRENATFLQAVREGNLLAVKSYARCKSVYINSRDKDNGASALIIAVMLRCTEPVEAKDIIMALCDEFKMDVDIKNFRGCTALHLAAGNNDVWAVNFLLSKYANPLCKNEFGDTPRQYGSKVNAEKFNPSIFSRLHEVELRYQASSSSLFSSRPMSIPALSIESKSEKKSSLGTPINLR